MPGAKTPATSTGTEATGSVETSTAMTLPVESTGTEVVATGTEATGSMMKQDDTMMTTGSTATGA